MDRQRRKQAEFLIHRFCDWSLIHEIAVIDNAMKTRVERILGRVPFTTPAAGQRPSRLVLLLGGEES